MLLDDPCDVIGPGKTLCENDGGGGGGAEPPESLDPLENLAREMGRAAAWTARQLGDVIGQAPVDITNPAFLRQYAVVFAGSTILVLLMWLLAVVRRALRAVPFTEAFGESIGLLWFAVAASAFTPLVLYTVLGAVGAVTRVLSSATGRPGTVFDALADDLSRGDVGGGPVMLAGASFVTIVLCGGLAVMVVVRTLGIYVGGVFAPVVYSALIQRDWWNVVQRWGSMMVAIIGVEPALVIIVGLSAAFQTSQHTGPVVTGIGISAVAALVIIRMVMKTPGAVATLKGARAVARGGGAVAGAVVGGSSPTQGVRAGIAAHSGRTSSSGGRSSSAGSGVAGGVAAHGDRKPRVNGTPRLNEKTDK